MSSSIFVKFSLERSFLTFINCWQAVFPVTEFNYHTAVTANTMTGFNIPIISFNFIIDTNLQRVFSSLLSGTEAVIPTISIRFLLEYWAFAKHCFSMLQKWLWSWLLAFLVIQSNPRIVDTHGSGQNCSLFAGVCFWEVWSKYTIFKLFTFLFAPSRYVDIFWQKGGGNSL